MNRVIFVLILLLIFFILELYAFQAFKELTAKSSSATQSYTKWIYWSFTALVFTAFLLFHFGNPEWFGKHGRTFLVSFVFINYLFKTLLCVFLFIGDLVRGAQWIAWKLAGPDVKMGEEGITRSRFLIQTGMIVAAAPVLSMCWGIVSGAHDYRIRRISLPIANLPEGLRGLRVLQLSDIHSGSFWSKEAVKKGIEMVQEEKADLILFTGDLVNNKASEMIEWKEHFGKLSAPLGVYSTLGNHDYGDYVRWDSEEEKKANFQALLDTHKEMGWQLMNNESRELEHQGEKFNLVGVENWSAKGRFPKYGDLNKATQGLDKDKPTILMSHDPSHWRGQILEDFNWIDLTLSGHTHGMQYGVEIPGFKWSPVQYFYNEWAGLYNEGNQNLYVNRGFGYIGYPGRFGILPEISVITLENKV